MTSDALSGLSYAMGTTTGLRASPAAVAAAGEAGTAFGDALTRAAPSFAQPFTEAAGTARVFGYAAIALSIALALGAVGFIVWQARKAVG